MSNPSTSQRFLFEHGNVRGEHIELNDQWQIILKQRDYPKVIQKILAEALACSILITSTLKFDGRLNLQIQPKDGEIALLVVQVKTGKNFRATVDWNTIPKNYDLKKLFGSANLLITLEQNEQSYQAIVDLSGDTLAQCIENYFQKSEQLDTKIYLANNSNKLSGFLIQKLPNDKTTEDNWQHAHVIADTIQPEEQLKWDTQALLEHLYPEDNIRLFEPEFWRFECACSQEKINSMIKSLGEAETDEIIAEHGAIDVECEFCHHKYHLDKIAVAQLFHPNTQTNTQLH